MAPPSAWFDPKMAFTVEEMYAGDCCHPDEAQALSDYLRGRFNKQKAAIVDKEIPSQKTYRIWALQS